MSLVLVADREAAASSNQDQTAAVIDLVSPERVLTHASRIHLRHPWKSRRDVKLLASELNALLPGGPIEVVVGEFRSPFAWAVVRKLQIPSESRIVIDDGTAMLRINRRMGVPYSRTELRAWLRRFTFGFIYRLIGLTATPPATGLTFFSAYDIGDRIHPGDRLVTNDYQVQRTMLRALPPDVENVYLIGTPHLEAGVVTGGDIELALDLIAQAKAQTGLRVVYMPHRRERAEKLDAIRAHCDVLVPDVPFELFPLRQGARPAHVVGYYSSLFVTLSILLGDAVRITAVDIPRANVYGSWQRFLDDVYAEYRTSHAATITVVPPNRSGQDGS